MIGKIIKLKNDLEYYIIDKITLDKKTYFFGVQVDNKSETLTNNYISLEMKLNDSDVLVGNIKDKKENERINNLFIERLEKQSN